MAWTPAIPYADFGLPLIPNLKAIIEANQAAALAWAASLSPAVSSLANFERVLECERVSKKFPSVAIYPAGDAPNYEDAVDITSVIGFEVAVTNRDPELLARELGKRVAAVRMLAVSSPSDLASGIGGSISRVIFTFGNAQFEQVREFKTEAGLYYRSAVFPITFRFIQTGG
jgi:hypothetical protein